MPDYDARLVELYDVDNPDGPDHDHVRSLAVGQLLDLGNSWKRAISLSAIFLFGVLAQMSGRVIGLGVGFAWLMSSKRRSAAAPKIESYNQAVSERRSLPAATSGKSVE